MHATSPATPRFPLVRVTGTSNAGKTTLIERLIGEFSSRGLRVGVAKETHHSGFDLDQPGKDSWRFSRAGAAAVLLNAPAAAALLEAVPERWSLERLAGLVGGRVDIMLAEGFRAAAAATIQVYRQGVSEALPDASGTLLAVVSDIELAISAPVFRPEETGTLADFLVEKLGIGCEEAKHTFAIRNDPGRNPGSLLSYGDFEMFLSDAAAEHGHMCAGLCLGVRMALRGCQELGLTPPDQEKRLLAYVEIDRCAADAVATVTGCRLGRRTLKFLDYGKLAATFLDLRTDRAVRVAAREEARERALFYVGNADDSHTAQLEAYQKMPDEELFTVQQVRVHVSPDDLPGRPHKRVRCAVCSEGINDGREAEQGGRILCKPCASTSNYYAPLAPVL